MFLQTLSKVFNTFGAPVFVPVVIFIISANFTCKNQESFLLSFICRCWSRRFYVTIKFVYTNYCSSSNTNGYGNWN